MCPSSQHHTLSNLEGTALCFISADGQTLFGAWTSQQHNNGPQPWFGTLICSRGH